MHTQLIVKTAGGVYIIWHRSLDRQKGTKRSQESDCSLHVCSASRRENFSSHFRRVPSFSRWASISRYWSPFCTNFTRRPTGTSSWLILASNIPASCENVKPECEKPASSRYLYTA
ncbi:hypothetical protein J8273_5378 [Carpediemonas membranifera]|uniref:Uncharacterized protein n=1 Tax=Carpediemonas membranifera TaxID=201153 RepID=A0A8J6AZS1_9EUKA|nr:hypothetical protein J8273_5378 [Carpediemonas membranifera]|eukprot:KAG9392388.1 hypothetical protein J8273_5378 [Carpediemonas membranifera]